MSKRRVEKPTAPDAVAGALPLDTFRALGDPTRLALVAWLAVQHGGHTVSEIAASGCSAVDFSVVSRHLRTLHLAGLVDAERQGREVIYRLRSAALAAALRKIADMLDSCSTTAAGRGRDKHPS